MILNKHPGAMRIIKYIAFVYLFSSLFYYFRKVFIMSFYRDHPLGKACSCDMVFRGFKWCDLRALKSTDLPGMPGVYVLRIAETGWDLKQSAHMLLELVSDAGWLELETYIRSRLDRLNRIGACPVIYIDSTGAEKGGLRSRLRDLAGKRHTAFYPIFVLLYSKWKIDYGFKDCKSNKEARQLEEYLKQKYRAIHGRPPALVEK